jgi:putative ABC transport system ATP-binding protein
MAQATSSDVDHLSQSMIAVARPLVSQLAVRAHEVSYFYGEGETRTQALFDNTLEIGRGEVVIMTGPSGSGKTTLLTLIGTLRRMQQGRLCVLDRDLTKITESEAVELRKQVGFIFQSHNLFSSLTAIDNVRMAMVLKPESSRSKTDCGIAILEQLGLKNRTHHLPGQLSGGQRQRVAIARALVNRPALVLADEPTAALDAESGQIVLSMLRKLADGPERSTVLIVTHDQRVIDRADRIVNMVGGRIVTNSLTRMTVRIARALAQSEALKCLSEATLTRIASVMIVENRKQGETIVREGETGDRYYLIGSGVAEAYKNEAFQEELYFGEGFGTISSFFKRQIPVKVVAKSDLELYVITQEEFERVLASDKSFEDRVRALMMAVNPQQG